MDRKFEFRPNTKKNFKGISIVFIAIPSGRHLSVMPEWSVCSSEAPPCITVDKGAFLSSAVTAELERARIVTREAKFGIGFIDKVFCSFLERGSDAIERGMTRRELARKGKVEGIRSK